MTLNRRAVHTPDDVDHLFIVTRPRNSPVVSFVSSATRHYAAGSDYEAVNAEATTVLLRVDHVPQKERSFNSNIVEASVGSDVALASNTQVNDWVDAYNTSRDYQGRPLFRFGHLYGLSVPFTLAFYTAFSVIAAVIDLTLTLPHLLAGIFASLALGVAASTWTTFGCRRSDLNRLLSTSALKRMAANQHEQNLRAEPSTAHA